MLVAVQRSGYKQARVPGAAFHRYVRRPVVDTPPILTSLSQSSLCPWEMIRASGEYDSPAERQVRSSVGRVAVGWDWPIAPTRHSSRVVEAHTLAALYVAPNPNRVFAGI